MHGSHGVSSHNTCIQSHDTTWYVGDLLGTGHPSSHFMHEIQATSVARVSHTGLHAACITHHGGSESRHGRSLGPQAHPPRPWDQTSRTVRGFNPSYDMCGATMRRHTFGMRPVEVGPPMADALHTPFIACHASRRAQQVDLAMRAKLRQLSATRARDGRSVQWAQ